MRIFKPFVVILSIQLFFFSSLFSKNENLCNLTLDVTALQEKMQNAKPIFSGLKFHEKPTIMFPLYDGTELEFTYEKASLMHPTMQANYPEIQSFYLQAVTNPSLHARVNISPQGLFAIFKQNGVITKIVKQNNSQNENEYIGTKIENNELNCEAIENYEPIAQFKQSTPATNSCFENGSFLRTFRFAFATTYEYVDFFGPSLSAVNSQIVNDLAGLSLIYESEVAITFQLAATNDVLTNITLAYPNSASDVFTDPFNTSTSLPAGNTFIDNNLNNADFDIGHSFHFNNGGAAAGLAGVGVVCGENSGGNYKARGYSIIRSATFEDYVLPGHEIGHQFSCRHTGYGCSSNNNCQRYETGQGVTIMSTGANCTSADDYGDRSGFFNMGSLQGMIDFIENGDVLYDNAGCTVSSTSRGMCAAQTITGNTVPVSNANPNGGNYTIPKGTPFILIGEGTDADNDMLTYNWEEYDTDFSGTVTPNNAGNSGTTTDPLFRVFEPSTSNTRVCPQLSSILDGNITTNTGEDLPEETRDMNWRFSVRDNFAGASAIACDEISIGVDASTGPFAITTQNAATSWVANGSNTANINWNVAGTTGGNVNCANVDIQFSTDGGVNFPYTLAANVANDGSYTITIPSYPTNIGRIRVICSDNIFFDLNNSDIEIISTCIANGANITPDAAVTDEEGSANLNLNLDVNYGTILSSITGTLDSSDDPVTLPALSPSSGNCVNYTNSSVYDAYEFVVDVSGDYSFSVSGAGFGFQVNLYNAPYDPNSPCNNVIYTAFNPDNSTINPPSNISLTAGSPYVLVAQGFGPGQPSLPTNYTITPSGPGNLFSGTPPPGAGFSYTYVIVDDATGNVVGFENNSNFSNASNYPGASSGKNYTVYGLSYESTANLANFIGSSFDNLSTDLSLLVVCGNLSVNSLDLTITSTGNVCPANYVGINTLTGIVSSSTADYETDGLIESNQFVSSGAQVDYDSAIEVLLSNGFECDQNADLYIFIDGCNNGAGGLNN